MLSPDSKQQQLCLGSSSSNSKQLGQTSETRKIIDWKIYEIDGSYLYLQRFDKFSIWRESYDRKRKLSEYAWICMGELVKPLHTVSFNWFMSVLERILNLEFCLLKLLICYQKSLWNIRSRLNSSTFWVFVPVFEYVWSVSSFFVNKPSILIIYISKYRPNNSKCRRVKPRSDVP